MYMCMHYMYTHSWSLWHNLRGLAGKGIGWMLGSWYSLPTCTCIHVGRIFCIQHPGLNIRSPLPNCHLSIQYWTCMFCVHTAYACTYVHVHLCTSINRLVPLLILLSCSLLSSALEEGAQLPTTPGAHRCNYEDLVREYLVGYVWTCVHVLTCTWLRQSPEHCVCTCTCPCACACTCKCWLWSEAFLWTGIKSLAQGSQQNKIMLCVVVLKCAI